MALLAVPILVFLMVSWTISRVLEDQLAESSATLVDLMGKEIDGKLDYVGRMFNDITWDPLTLSLMNQTRLNDGSKRFDMVRLADRMAIFNGYSRFSDFFFLALPNLKTVLIPRYSYHFDRFQESYFEGPGINQESLSAVLAVRHEGGSVPVVYKDALGQPQQAVAILQSLPAGASSPIDAVIGVLVNRDTIIDSLHATIKASRSEIRILNEKGQVIVTSLELPWLEDQNGQKGVQIGGEDYTVLQRNTRQFGWTVQLLVPDSILKEKLLFAQLITLTGLLACLVLGFFLTAYLVRRNYGPVSRLVQSLSGRDSRVSADEDEFSQIHRAVQRVQDRFERNKEPLRQNLVARLLRGQGETGISLEDSLSALDLTFTIPEFLVYLVHFHDDGESGGKIPEVFQHELEHQMESAALVLRAPEDNPMTYLLCLQNDATPETLTDLQERVILCGQQLRERLGYPQLKFASAFSSVVHSVSAIPTAWQQAKTALEYRFVVGGDHPFTWDELKLEKPAALYHYDAEREIKLMTVIKAGDEKTAMGIVDEIIDENTRPTGPRLSAMAAQALIWDVSATIMKALTELSEGDETFTSLFESIPILAQSPQLDRVRQGMHVVIGNACQYARDWNQDHTLQLKTSANRQFIQQVCSYLQAQFRDPSLNLTKMAEVHNLTPAYLSRLFRENMEEGIFDYLNRIRIEQAKILLRTSGTNLQETGLACGFLDVKTFIRIFRKFTGVTPGKYRETAK